ncbi:MAG: DUF559 domain-containing protein [Patescibacteria group bacterium]
MWREILFNSSKMKTRRLYLRKKLTKWESILWEELRNNKLGVKFKRQYSVGPYILDFYSTEASLGIELDGQQHKSNTEYDIFRSKYLKSLGINILRFWNNQIENDLEKVILIIKGNIPSPVAGEGNKKGEV